VNLGLQDLEEKKSAIFFPFDKDCYAAFVCWAAQSGHKCCNYIKI